MTLPKRPDVYLSTAGCLLAAICLGAFVLAPTCAAANDVASARSLIAPTYLEDPPVLDGIRSEGEWDRVTMTTGFLYTDATLAVRQTEVWAAFDEENLYFCFRTENPGGVRATVTDRDIASLFQEDVVEIFLQPSGEGSYYQFAANGLDTQFDSEKEAARWNGAWKSASAIVKDQWYVGAAWTIELAIPFRTLGVSKAPVDGTVWRGNLCRTWTAVDFRLRATTWAHVGSAFHNPSKFGELLFDRSAPAVQLSSMGDLNRGQIALQGVVAADRKQEIDLA